MQTAQFRAEILRPWLLALEPIIRIRRTEASEILLLAIAIQESGLDHRYQVSQYGSDAHPGPARGWWQFETTGVAGVLNHPRTEARAQSACDHLHVFAHPHAVWRAIEGHDGLAVAFARLLLWSDPVPLPTDESGAWDCYLRNWRPGRPIRAKWAACWRMAHEAQLYIWHQPHSLLTSWMREPKS